MAKPQLIFSSSRATQSQPPTSRETSSINARRSPYCHVERSETSLIIVWELEERPEILRFAQDDNSVFEYGAWNLNLQIISSEPREIATDYLRLGVSRRPFGAIPRDDRVSLCLQF